MLFDVIEEHHSHAGVGEVRQVVVVGLFALVKRCFLEGRHMGRDEHVTNIFTEPVKPALEVRSTIIGEFLHKLGQFTPIDTRSLLLNEYLVVQSCGRVNDPVAGSAISPTIMAKKNDPVGEMNHSAVGKPDNSGVAPLKRTDLSANRADGAMVIIVIAKNCVQRNPKNGRKFEKMLAERLTVRNVASEDHAIWPIITECQLDERVARTAVRDIEVNIGEPNQFHRPSMPLGCDTTLPI